MQTNQTTASHHSTSHGSNPVKVKEHAALLDLLPHSQATHVAVKNGSWFDPNTWASKKVPSTGAKVLIPYGKTVSYDGESEDSLKIVRVDGNLEFATNKNTKLVVDTLITDTKSNLQIGTASDPIQSDKTAKIVIDGSKAINKGWDPTLISRGVITHGRVRMFGQDKADFVTLAKDAKAGDSQLLLKSPPKGWKVGDQLVLGGTGKNENGSHANNSKFQDEVLTITSIKGKTVQFTNNDIKSGAKNVLRFDHVRPQGFQDKLNLYVANTSRNIVFETANAAKTPTQQRGHVMFMHNPDVIVENAGFYNLGRSDKDKLVDDVGRNKDGRSGKGTNPRGRYSFHFHRTGADDINGVRAVARGNAVVGSPGWAMVQHDSHALLDSNVVFDVVGTGIAAEDGNEIGWWTNNLTIKTTGSTQNRGLTRYGPASARIDNFDMGVQGEGYWVQGAGQVGMSGNIAISAAGASINLFGGGDGGEKARTINEIKTKNLPKYLQPLANGKDTIDVTQVPLLKFTGFESYNAEEGIIVWGRVRDDKLKRPNDIRTKIEDFKLWNIEYKGVDVLYSTKIDFENGLLLGEGENNSFGVTTNQLGKDIRMKNLRVEGFDYGVKEPLDKFAVTEATASTIENSYLANNGQHLFSLKDNKPTAFSDYFRVINTKFGPAFSKNTPPKAAFKAQSIGAKMTFDASDSFDADIPQSKSQSNLGIASYGWDFDGDDKIDRWGRVINQRFDTAGKKQVKLTVWDGFGAANSLLQTIDVKAGGSNNPGEQNGGGGSSLINLSGTRKDDVLIGNSQNQKINGNSGNDKIRAGGGNDFVKAGKGNDIVDGDGGKDRLLGGAGDDTIRGGLEDDQILGDGGNDKLFGGVGNDIVDGKKGNDVVSGVDATIASPGRAELDYLFGGQGADKFLLGDKDKAYYNDGLLGSSGEADLAIVKDFNRSAGDTIQLHGRASDYRLGAAPIGKTKDVGIFLKAGQKQEELIAVVANSRGLNLNSAAFNFV
ncbi:MAG: G8 domain-containing protein [Cyanobacteria bacterium J06650_10]